MSIAGRKLIVIDATHMAAMRKYIFFFRDLDLVLDGAAYGKVASY